MSRYKKQKDAYYFPHDSNAATDEKLVQLLSVYGFKGYGWYWRLIELMRDSRDFKLDISGKYSYQGLSEILRCSKSDFVDFITDCLSEFKSKKGETLLTSDGDSIWSESLKRRMAHIDKVRAMKREFGIRGAEKRWGKKRIAKSKESSEKPIAPQKQLSENHSTDLKKTTENTVSNSKEKSKTESHQPSVSHGKSMVTQCKGKERKGKERKGKERTEQIRTEEEKDKICLLRKRPTAANGKELFGADFLSRMNKDEFEIFQTEIKHMIVKHNLAFPSSLFVWNPLMGSMESDLKKLVYGKRDEEKQKLLFNYYSMLNEKLNWALLVKKVIASILRRSNRTPVREPYKLTMWLLERPAVLAGEGK